MTLMPKKSKFRKSRKGHLTGLSKAGNYIDFGEFGTKTSSARLVDLYTKEDLIGRLVLCVTNFLPRQIGPFVSESLTLGVPDKDGKCILITPDKELAEVGGKLF